MGGQPQASSPAPSGHNQIGPVCAVVFSLDGSAIKVPNGGRYKSAYSPPDADQQIFGPNSMVQRGSEGGDLSYIVNGVHMGAVPKPAPRRGYATPY